MHRMLLVYQSSYRHLNRYVEPLSPLSRFATNVLPAKTQILSLTVSFFLWTDTNKNQQLHHFLSTYARNTLCLSRFPFSIHPTILLYDTVPNSHRRSLSLYRSDQIEQMLTLYNTRILLVTSMTKKQSRAAAIHQHDDGIILFFVPPVDLLRSIFNNANDWLPLPMNRFQRF